MCRPVNSITYLSLLLFSYRAEKTEVLSDDLLQVTTSFHTLALFALDVICCLLENATLVLYERFIEAFYIRTVCQVGFVSWHCKMIFFFSFFPRTKTARMSSKVYLTEDLSTRHSPLSVFCTLPLPCETDLSSVVCVCFLFANAMTHHSDLQFIIS